MYRLSFYCYSLYKLLNFWIIVLCCCGLFFLLGKFKDGTIMKHSISKRLNLVVWIFIGIMAIFTLNRLEATDSATISEQFSDPPRECHSAPLWVWNDMLTDEQIVGTLQDLAGQQVMQVFVHPRPGLMTPYLSKEWFRLWKVALEEAERLDLNVWIYDENTVIITASPFTIYHELEPAYVLGIFTFRETDSGFVIAGGSEHSLELGSWKEQGYPFYAAGVCYKQKFNVTRPAGQYLIELGEWYGSVAEIVVNNNNAGYIAYKLWRCDVSDLIKQGMNTIDVIVIGTLKNTLGPHHAGIGLGSAWPGMYQQGPETGPPPGKNYHTIDYGLFELFILKLIVEK